MDEILLGVEHITDWKGYDHMLYLLALIAWASLSNAWRVLVLATAFTVGHSITLLLAGMGWVHPNGAWIEFLIPVTIALTALWNLRRSAAPEESSKRFSALTYLMTVMFGLIHGLGFSSFFRMMQDHGDSIILPLFRFNVGVEIGQLALLLGFLAMASLLRAAGVRARDQQVFICAVTGTIAVMMALDRLPF